MRQYTTQPSDQPNKSLPHSWFENVALPLDEEVNWEKWNAKADELCRIGAIAAAGFVYECSERSLRRQILGYPKQDLEKCLKHETLPIFF